MQLRCIKLAGVFYRLLRKRVKCFLGVYKCTFMCAGIFLCKRIFNDLDCEVIMKFIFNLHIGIVIS